MSSSHAILFAHLTITVDCEQSAFVPEILHVIGKVKILQVRKRPVYAPRSPSGRSLSRSP